jgi:peptidoglycan hydrolase-like protein with peptidoglycan-binding domain/predicted chitinase
MSEQNSSRDPSALHPELSKRWELARTEFGKRFPDLPEVFLTSTFRSRLDQAKTYAQGRTAPGKVVTNAKPGQSLHNYYPSLAFDIAFKQGGELIWDLPFFQRFAEIAKPLGLEWGGDWPNFKDNPHFQPPGFTWEMAANGQQPIFPGVLPPGDIPAPPPAKEEKKPTVTISRVLRQGSKGPEVRQLQERLAELGFDPGEPDGIFGDDTEAAVEDFQECEGLLMDGIAGPQTLAALDLDLNFEPEPAAGVLRVGSRGPRVVKLQERLAALGFDPGPIDGIFGQDTESAVFDFQQDQGLESDGIAGPNTLKALAADLPPEGEAGEAPEAPEESLEPPPGTTPAELQAFTVDFVTQLFPDATPRRNIARYLPYILKALAQEGIADDDMALMALATIRAESDGFAPINELKSKWNTSPDAEHNFDRYDDRGDLGNQGYPDGANFKGRGFIQLTGRDNYTRYSKALGLGDELVQNPEKANDPEIAARLLAKFLKDKEAKIRFALRNDNLAAARKMVNGGSHGLSQFTEAFTIGKSLLA